MKHLDERLDLSFEGLSSVDGHSSPFTGADNAPAPSDLVQNDSVFVRFELASLLLADVEEFEKDLDKLTGRVGVEE